MRHVTLIVTGGRHQMYASAADSSRALPAARSFTIGTDASAFGAFGEAVALRLENHRARRSRIERSRAHSRREAGFLLQIEGNQMSYYPPPQQTMAAAARHERRRTAHSGTGSRCASASRGFRSACASRKAALRRCRALQSRGSRWFRARTDRDHGKRAERRDTSARVVVVAK